MKHSMRKITLALAMLPILGNMTASATGLLSTSYLQNQGLVQVAQATDPRITQLQEQIRELSGKVEELNFQILQMQEQMRNTQEDNEFRFQELEDKKRTDAGQGEQRNVASAHPANPPAEHHSAEPAAQATQQTTQKATQGHLPFPPAPDVNSAQAGAQAGADSVAIGGQVPQPGLGEPPRQLGSIRFDANGNVIGETLDVAPRQTELQTGHQIGAAQTPAQAPDQANQPAQSFDAGQVLASLPQQDNPNALYNAAYDYILEGNYPAAEVAFKAHIDRYPADPMTADARYWLGEALYSQQKYKEAATVFLDTQRDYPDSKRGAENMLKLGLSMLKLDNKSVACATLSKIKSQYPAASPVVVNRVTEEKSKAGC